MITGPLTRPLLRSQSRPLVRSWLGEGLPAGAILLNRRLLLLNGRTITLNLS